MFIESIIMRNIPPDGHTYPCEPYPGGTDLRSDHNSPGIGGWGAMKLKLKKGTTGKLLRIFVQDTSRSDGGGLTGLTNASAGLAWHTLRKGDSDPPP